MSNTTLEYSNNITSPIKVPLLESVKVIVGGKEYILRKFCLVMSSKYFKALFSMPYIEKEALEHNFADAEALGLIHAQGFEHISNYINNNEMETNMDMDTLVCVVKSASYLQCVAYENELWNTIRLRMSPHMCLENAKCFNYNNNGALVVLKDCLRQMIWKIYDTSLYSKIGLLTPAEFYWILRNPFLVSYSNGTDRLALIDKYTTQVINSMVPENGEYNSKEFNILRDKAIRQTRARFIFALMEGMEENITKRNKTFSSEYKRKAVLPNLCKTDPVPERKKLKLSLSSESNELYLKSLAVTLTQTQQSIDTSQFYLTCEDVETILEWRKDQNVFRSCIEMQNKHGLFVPCIAGFTKKEGAVIMGYDPDGNTINTITQLPNAGQGFQLASYGSEVLYFGGESKIGSNKFFKNCFSYSHITKEWTERPISPGLIRRHFPTCWYGDEGILIAGGYGNYRTPQHSIGILTQCAHLADKNWWANHDTVWTYKPQDEAALKDTGYSLGLMILTSDVESRLLPRTVMAYIRDHLLLFFANKDFSVYCHSTSTWHTRSKPLVCPFPNIFTGAYPFGVGIYFTVSYSKYVYWIPIDEMLIKKYGKVQKIHRQDKCKDVAGNAVPADCDTENDEENEEGRENGFPIFELVKYGKFNEEPCSVCRVEDKLYSFCHAEKDDQPTVECMTLQYNPLAYLMSKSSKGKLNKSDVAVRSVNTKISSNSSKLVECGKEIVLQDVFPSKDLLLWSSSLHHRYAPNERPSCLQLVGNDNYVYLTDAEQNTSSASDSPPECGYCMLLIRAKSSRGCFMLPPLTVAEVVWSAPGNCRGITFRNSNCVTSGSFPLYDPFSNS